MSIQTLIRDYVLENFLYTDDESKLGNDDSFLENGVIDSTGVVELVMFVEETFGFKVADEDIVPEHFDSVERLACYVQLNVAQAMPDAGELVAVGQREIYHLQA